MDDDDAIIKNFRNFGMNVTGCSHSTVLDMCSHPQWGQQVYDTCSCSCGGGNLFLFKTFNRIVLCFFHITCLLPKSHVLCF